MAEEKARQSKTPVSKNIDVKDFDAQIGVAAKGDTGQFLHPTTDRVQPMKGFAEDYIDIVDYILRCTHKIWEEGGIGHIYTHYKNTIAIQTAEGWGYGRDAVIGGSTQVMSAFPDIRLYGDDVIWAGNEDDGYHTSHRISWTGTNTGYSKYGPPTGKKLYRFGIANCLCKENMIIEEWIARDEMSLILQMGYNPWEMAAKMSANAEPPAFAPPIQSDLRNGQDYPAPLAPFREPFDVDDFVRHTIHEIWNWRMVNKVADYYIDNFQYFGPSGRTLYGRGNYKTHVISLLSTFPDLKMNVDHVYWNGSPERGYRVCVRWMLEGTHELNGIYGEPTGKRVSLMGISHMHIKDGKFVKDYTAFDEFALFKQLYTPEIHGYFEN